MSSLQESLRSEAGMDFSRLPRHVGLIPDGNRRWAEAHDRRRSEGYAAGMEPGFGLLGVCRQLGIEEVSIYGFTKENVHRPNPQVGAFRAACVEVGLRLVEEGTALLVVGDTSSKVFPDALRPFARSRSAGDLRVNLLVNYGWRWNLQYALEQSASAAEAPAPLSALASSAVSRVDLVIRWGGHRRLSGFLPIQCAYADMYVARALWPDMKVQDFLDALDWYQHQDVTLGG